MTDGSKQRGNETAVRRTTGEPKGSLTGLPRSVASALRTALVHALHPVRRRLAIRRLQRGSTPASILVLCHGNVCRSPFAEAVLSRELGTGLHTVSSAGFVGPGRETPPEGVETARRMGFDLTGHISRSVNRSMLEAADLVVVMDKRQSRAVHGLVGEHRILMLGDLDPLLPRRRSIADPWGHDAGAYEASYTRIQRCVTALAALLRSVASMQRSCPAIEDPADGRPEARAPGAR